MVGFNLGSNMYGGSTGNLFVATDGHFFDKLAMYYNIYLCAIIGVVSPSTVVRDTLNCITLISASTFLMVEYLYLVVLRMAVQLSSLMRYCHIVFLLLDLSNLKGTKRQDLSRYSGFFYHTILGEPSR